MTVTAADIPEWLAEASARAAHERGCSDGWPGDFDADRVHRKIHLSTASNYLADLCNAFGVTPDDFAWLMDGPA